MVGLLAADLLGRHVTDRAETDPGPLWSVSVGCRESPTGCRALAGQAEVEDLDAAVAGQEDVLGLQVAVDDAFLVRGGQAEGDLAGDLDGACGRKRAVVEPLAQRLALEQLGDGVSEAVDGAEVVDGQDVGVGERGDRLRLALEAGERRRVLGDAPREGP